jgi:hypothetical protein
LGEITNHKTQSTKNVTHPSAYSYWISFWVLSPQTSQPWKMKAVFSFKMTGNNNPVTHCTSQMTLMLTTTTAATTVML